MSETLKQEMQDGLLVLTMNRPERRNALNPEMTEALRDAAARAAGDDSVRAVLLRGAGGHFCVGGDVKAMNEGRGQDMSRGERRHQLRDRMSVSQALHDMPKPTIALIEGSAAGAGLSMALACDLRICAEDAKLTTAFAKVGLSGDFGGTWFLTQLVGTARARQLYLMSPVLTGREAADLGLVTESHPADQVVEAAFAVSKRLAAGPTLAFGRIKENIALAESGHSLAESLDCEARNHILSMETEDHREAAAAFVEKRQPVLKGA